MGLNSLAPRTLLAFPSSDLHNQAINKTPFAKSSPTYALSKGALLYHQMGHMRTVPGGHQRKRCRNSDTRSSGPWMQGKENSSAKSL